MDLPNFPLNGPGVRCTKITFHLCAYCVTSTSATFLDMITWTWSNCNPGGKGASGFDPKQKPPADPPAEVKGALDRFRENHRNGTYCPEERG
ncbi:MAG TPA: hypothetical protein VHF22_09610 [Planctomycetota bacterium]|nr:hypothetical protein [Planctomycetota bacterium]